MARKVDILVIGGGGRERAIIGKLLESERCGQVYFAPGNGGGSLGGRVINVPIKATAINELLQFALKKKIGLTIVGPEDPLIAGIVGAFHLNGLQIFGPTTAAAQLEGNKAWMKKLCLKYGIPTAPSEVFDNYQAALDFVIEHGAPIVVKAVGPALGKGAFVCQTVAEAKEALRRIMVDREFGNSGNLVVIEDCLSGQEISIQAVCSGNIAKCLLPSQDYKRQLDGDQGPNTGSMGAYCPVPWVSKEMLRQIEKTIIQPLLDAMIEEGCPYTGLLYPGLMMTANGPMVLEVNCRFGDPETQVVLPLLKTDLLAVLQASVDGTLDRIELDWSPEFCVGVIMASRGYPGTPEKGYEITGIELSEIDDKVTVYPAGVAAEGGKLVTSGGRVLCVTARGETPEQAISSAYGAIAYIDFEGEQHRLDIARSALSPN